MDRKHFIFYLSSALCCILITVAAAVSFNDSTEIIHREFSDSFTVYFQTDAGTHLSAIVDSGENTAVLSKTDEFTPDYTVNINTASAYELAVLLPGIGEKKAASIVEYRNIVGSFNSVDELTEVDGINRNLLEKLRPYCRLSDIGSSSD